MITAIILITPDNHLEMNPELLKRKIRYATSSRDGTVKIWNAHTMQLDTTIQVTTKAWVTCMTYMSGSKKLACGSANRMISFYKMD